MADNRDLHKQVDNIKAEYQQKEDNLEWKYEYRINKLEKENGYLHKVIDKFRETIHKFIEWICVNFDMGTGDTLIRDFEKETRKRQRRWHLSEQWQELYLWELSVSHQTTL